MDTQNDGLEKVTPLQKCQFLVSMLDFWSVTSPSKGPFLEASFRGELTDLDHRSPWGALFGLLVKLLHQNRFGRGFSGRFFFRFFWGFLVGS